MIIRRLHEVNLRDIDFAGHKFGKKSVTKYLELCHLLLIHLNMTIYWISEGTKIFNLPFIWIWHQILKCIFWLRSLATSRRATHMLEKKVSKHG